MDVEQFDELYDAIGAENWAEARDAENIVLADVYAEKMAVLERWLKAGRLRGDDDGTSGQFARIPRRPSSGPTIVVL